jgi:hypothetical protein
MGNGPNLLSFSEFPLMRKGKSGDLQSAPFATRDTPPGAAYLRHRNGLSNRFQILPLAPKTSRQPRPIAVRAGRPRSASTSSSPSQFEPAPRGRNFRVDFGAHSLRAGFPTSAVRRGAPVLKMRDVSPVAKHSMARKILLVSACAGKEEFGNEEICIIVGVGVGVGGDGVVACLVIDGRPLH